MKDYLPIVLGFIYTSLQFPVVSEYFQEHMVWFNLDMHCEVHLYRVFFFFLYSPTSEFLGPYILQSSQ